MQENAKRPLSALEEAEEAQRRVIQAIAKEGLPCDPAAELEKRAKAQAARLSNPNAVSLLQRFAADPEACR